MWPLSLFARWQRQRYRTNDRTFLFPAIRAQQTSWEDGALAILYHVRHDVAWHCLEE